MAGFLQNLIRIANGLASNDGSGDSLRTGANVIAANFDAVKDTVNALAASQNSGLIAYATKAAMDADLSKPDATLAQVTNDATISNNQAYRKSGAAGTGSWVAAVDRITGATQFQQLGTGSVLRTMQDKAREVVSVKDMGALGLSSNDDTASLANIAGLSNGRATLPAGAYPTSGLALSQPKSFTLQGDTSGLGAVIQYVTANASPSSSSGATGKLLSIGDGVSANAFHFTLDRIGINAQDNGMSALFIDKLDRSQFSNGLVYRFRDGIGVSNNVGTSAGVSPDYRRLLQDTLFLNFDVRNIDTYNGSRLGTGFKLYPTGELSFVNCDVENVNRGMELYSQSQQPVTIFGGRMERIDDYSLRLDGGAFGVYGMNIESGKIRLGPSSAFSDVYLPGALSTTVSRAGVSDLGFANRIRAIGSVGDRSASKAPMAENLAWTGLEWLYANGIVHDPCFVNGVQNWAATNCSRNLIRLTAPGVPYGKTLRVKGSGTANGYVEEEFACEADTDYLAMVVFTIWGDSAANSVPTNIGNARFEVLDTSSNVLLDSGVIDMTGDLLFQEPWGNAHRYFVYRKRIHSPTGNGTVKVRIFTVGTAGSTDVSFVQLFKSAVKFENTTQVPITSATKTGSGTSYTLTQDVKANNLTIQVTGQTFKGQGFLYFRANVTDDVIVGISGVQDSETAGAQFRVRNEGGTVEQCLPLASFPVDSKIVLQGVNTGATITLSDLALVPVNPMISPQSVNASVVAAQTAAFDVPVNPTIARGRLAKAQMSVGTTISADAANFWTFAFQKKRGSGAWATLATVTTASSALSADAVTQLSLDGSDDIALESGDQLRLHATKTGTPASVTGLCVQAVVDPGWLWSE